MSLVCYTPRGRLGLLRPFDDIERDFTELLGGLPRPLDAWTPRVDVIEGKDAYTLEVELPGVAKEDVHIEVQNNEVTISGERKNEHVELKEGYHRFERSYGRFERTFAVPMGFDDTHVEAKLDNGILLVTLPKREEAKPKQIAVTVH